MLSDKVILKKMILDVNVTMKMYKWHFDVDIYIRLIDYIENPGNETFPGL